MTGQTALVVDDSRSARYAMRKLLESGGYSVDTAESAQDAYVYLQRRRPEVIFLDHQMPGANGLDVLRTLKKSASSGDIPVVICSSDRHDAFVRVAREAGAIDVLTKPPDSDQFGALIRHLRTRAPTDASDRESPPALEPSDNGAADVKVELSGSDSHGAVAKEDVPQEGRADIGNAHELATLRLELAALKAEVDTLRAGQQLPIEELVDRLLPGLLQALEIPLRHRAQRAAARVLQRVAERLLQEASTLPSPPEGNDVKRLG